MTPDIFACGVAERDKADVHLVMLACAFAMGMYNLLACRQRPEWRLAVNAALYFGIVLWERHNVHGHLERERTT